MKSGFFAKNFSKRWHCHVSVWLNNVVFNFCLADTMGKECNKTTEHKAEEIERALSAI